jgi:hypothetical protein
MIQYSRIGLYEVKINKKSKQAEGSSGDFVNIILFVLLFIVVVLFIVT